MSAPMMRAAILHGQRDLRIEQVPRPIAERGDIVLRVEAALTCGTDLKVYKRGYHARMLKPPVCFGHEVAGTVFEVGEGVAEFRKGDRVVALNSAPCDKCFFCTHGQQNLCEDLLFNNGAYAEYMRIPARIVEKNTLHIPEGVPFEHAALTEPLACCLRGIEESGVQSGDSVVVLGAGPIGLLFLRALSVLGAKTIAVVRREQQVAIARTFGANQAVVASAETDVIAAVRALTPANRGADAVLEAVAQPLTWEWAVEMVRKGGVVNFFGGPPAGTKVALDTNLLHYGDITLKASFHHTPATARRAFAMVCDSKFRSQDFLTGRIGLDELQTSLERLENRGDEIKFVVHPHGAPA